MRNNILTPSLTSVGVLFMLCLLSFPASALPVSGNSLIENAKTYDGKTVTFEGEAIGDIMARGNHAWINVNDGLRAIGIWAKKDLVDKITCTGNYRFTGDTIKIKGTFHRACAQHGGDLDIHAQEIMIIKKGYARSSPIGWPKIFLAFLLLIGTIAFVFYPRTKINS
jgi:hypothetical protein